jgi:sulfite exporter TauE/SafE
VSEFSYLSAFLIGIAGGVHCIGMCGGIASAFAFAIPKNKSHTPYIACYNAGRVISYTLAGALTGLLGSLFTSSVVTGLLILQSLSIVFLLLLALYISDVYKGLIYFEKAGAKLWRHLAPFGKKLIPFKSPLHTLLYGMIWGWLPCGLVYSALTWSLASGSLLEGGLFMLFFGLGTLPALVATSLGASFLIPILQHKRTRLIISSLLVIFAIFLILELFQGITS